MEFRQLTNAPLEGVSFPTIKTSPQKKVIQSEFFKRLAFRYVNVPTYVFRLEHGWRNGHLTRSNLYKLPNFNAATSGMLRIQNTNGIKVF